MHSTRIEDLQRSLMIYRLLAVGLLVVCVGMWFWQSMPETSGRATSRTNELSSASGIDSPDSTSTPLANRMLREGRPEFPIQFVPKMNEYQLVYFYTNAAGAHVTARHPLNYDPFTGARLPESTRASLFTTPDPGEAERIMERLRDAATLADVERILGKPDAAYPGTDDVKQQWTYSRLSKTFRLIVMETNDGDLRAFYVGQEKE